MASSISGSASGCVLPPDAPLSRVREGIDACVHCGFCLQACPTYLALEDENDSPRGRILLMRSLVDGSVAVDDSAMREHIDRCLGCRACETVCPSGVPYGELLEATRATLVRAKPMSFTARIVLWPFRRAKLLSLIMLGARLVRASGVAKLLSRLPGRFGFSMAMLASTSRPAKAGHSDAAGDGSRGRVSLLTGCVMEGLFTQANRATERSLRANDYHVVVPPGQQCCGALHTHAGDADNARALARRNIEAFEAVESDYVVVNAAGCGAMLKEYGRLLRDDPSWAERGARLSAKVRDVTELLAAAGPKPGGALALKVTYAAPCHLLHAQRISAPPLTTLRAIPGLELVPLADVDQCCGSAGIYNLLQPEISRAVLLPKLDRIGETNADVVATGNPGCLMQIGAGLLQAGQRARTVHPVELLDQSYASTG